MWQTYWNSLTKPKADDLFFANLLITQFAHPSLLIDCQLEVLGISAAGLSQLANILNVLNLVLPSFLSSFFLIFFSLLLSSLCSLVLPLGYGPPPENMATRDEMDLYLLALHAWTADNQRIFSIKRGSIPFLHCSCTPSSTLQICFAVGRDLFFLNPLRSGRCNLRGIVDIGYLQPLVVIFVLVLLSHMFSGLTLGRAENRQQIVHPPTI